LYISTFSLKSVNRYTEVQMILTLYVQCRFRAW